MACRGTPQRTCQQQQQFGSSHPAEELLPLELRLGHAVARSRMAAAAFLQTCAAGAAACETLEAGAAGFKRSYYQLQVCVRACVHVCVLGACGRGRTPGPCLSMVCVEVGSW